MGRWQKHFNFGPPENEVIINTEQVFSSALLDMTEKTIKENIMGIIGGSDGPTVIFVTSTLDVVLLIVGAVVVIGAIITLIVWRKKKRSK